MKKVVIVYGWEGYPEECWFPWLKKELEGRGFEVYIPEMPNPEAPKIGAWVDYLKKNIDKVDENTYFVCHSTGCQAVIRFLENLTVKVGGCIFVGGWFNLLPASYEDEEDKKIAKPWLQTPIDFDKVKKNCSKFVAIFSDNDPFVPLSDADLFKEKLNAKTIIEKNKGHLGDDANIKKLPIVLHEILKIK